MGGRGGISRGGEDPSSLLFLVVGLLSKFPGHHPTGKLTGGGFNIRSGIGKQTTEGHSCETARGLISKKRTGEQPRTRRGEIKYLIQLSSDRGIRESVRQSGSWTNTLAGTKFPLGIHLELSRRTKIQPSQRANEIKKIANSH